jgi:copper homeostasis protein
MEKYQIEICTNSVESCLAAQEGGANRVELCAGIPEGGTTPSYGEIAIAREVLTHTRLHVIIRPRGGDFLYSDIEIRTMLKDIEIARRLGADGVVFGCLTADGEVDLTSMQILMEASKGLSVTFHRAFDVCRNPQKALEEIIELGCNRILTSGQQNHDQPLRHAGHERYCIANYFLQKCHRQSGYRNAGGKSGHFQIGC